MFVQGKQKLHLPQTWLVLALVHLDVNPQHCHFLLDQTCKTMQLIQHKGNFATEYLATPLLERQIHPLRAGEDKTIWSIRGEVAERHLPEEIHEHNRASVHCDRTLQSFNLTNMVDGPSNATMHTYNLLLNQSCKWQPVEELIDSLPHPKTIALPL